MTWAQAALFSAAIMAIVSIIDSHLTSKRFPSFRAYLLPLGAVHLTYSLVASRVFPVPAGIDSSIIGIAILSSCIRTGAIFIFLHSLRYREVSTVVPVVYTSPVFVGLMAFFLLGEKLSLLQWSAIVVVVSGAVLISAVKGPSRTDIRQPGLALLLLASLLFAVSDVTAKQALGQLGYWHLFWMGAGVMGLAFVVGSLNRKVLVQIRDMERRAHSLRLMALNEVLSPIGIVVSFWALAHGPVSLVSTLVSSRPLFVLFFALVLSRGAPGFLVWEGGRRQLVLKLVATTMIVAGVVAIEVSS
ncbi:MAG: DMT family transporter [Dehalococcoidia bacterium]|nr:DMT family transporter [Dehalococcoidia bacterium]